MSTTDEVADETALRLGSSTTDEVDADRRVGVSSRNDTTEDGVQQDNRRSVQQDQWWFVQPNFVSMVNNDSSFTAGNADRASRRVSERCDFDQATIPSC